MSPYMTSAGVPPFSSLGRSIAATAPAFPAPIYNQDQIIRGGFAGAQNLVIPPSVVGSGAPVVSRKPRLKGLRFLYAHGAQRQTWFRMIATGQCESSKFQPYLTSLFDASFNDTWHTGGYPRNNGWSVKVASVPNALVNGGSQPIMQPAPNQRRVIFTRRAYNTMPAVPAKPAAQ